MTDLSVVICSHNPRAEYLRRVLAALRAQTLGCDEWELLLIDNASSEPLAQGWDLSWHPRARHVREDELGLTPARLRGIREAKGALLVFVDDENVLERGYLGTVVALARHHPHLGVFGAGRLEPEFEVAPPRELTPLLSFLALRSVTTERWSNHLQDSACYPWGAGLIVRREVAARFAGLIRDLNITELLGRRGGQLFCAEDDLFSWAAVPLGQGFGLFPQLQVTHLINAGRVTRAYFLRLLRAHAFSHAVLDFLLQETPPPSLHATSVLRTLVHGVRDGLFAMKCDLAVARGRKDATRFIASNALRPLGARSQDPPLARNAAAPVGAGT